MHGEQDFVKHCEPNRAGVDVFEHGRATALAGRGRQIARLQRIDVGSGAGLDRAGLSGIDFALPRISFPASRTLGTYSFAGIRLLMECDAMTILAMLATMLVPCEDAGAEFESERLRANDSIPGARVWIGLADVAFDDRVQRHLKLSSDVAAALSLLRDELTAQQRSTAIVLASDSWSLLKFPKRRIGSDRLTSKILVRSLKEILGDRDFHKLRGIYAAARGPHLCLDPECRSWVDTKTLLLRFRKANSRSLETLKTTLSNVVDSLETRRRVRADMESALAPHEFAALRALHGGEWPSELVEHLTSLPRRYGPGPWYPTLVDWASDWNWLPALLANSAVQDALKLDQSQRDGIKLLWDQSLVAQREYFESYAMLSGEDAATAAAVWLKRKDLALAELQSRMLASLAADQQTRAWSLLARLVTIGNVFHGAMKGALKTTKEQNDASLDLMKSEGFNVVREPFLVERVEQAPPGKNNIPPAKKPAFVTGLPEKAPNVERYDLLLEAKIFTPAQREIWQQWRNCDVSLSPKLRPCQAYASPRAIAGADVGTGILWK